MTKDCCGKDYRIDKQRGFKNPLAFHLAAMTAKVLGLTALSAPLAAAGPLVSLNGHLSCADECPLSGVKRTSLVRRSMSANDP
jgi:hypothetical protein